MDKIHSFLRQVGQQKIRDGKYNGISIKQSSIPYQQLIEKLFNDAVSDLNISDEQEREILIKKINEIQIIQKIFEVIPNKAIALLHDAYNNQTEEERKGTLFSSEEYRFYQKTISECVAIQKVFLKKFASIVSEAKGKDTTVNKKPDKETNSNGSTSMEALRDKEWLTAKETASRYPSLAYNNIKSRNWRISNKFPYEGYDERKGAHNKVVFNSMDVENWIRNHDIR